MVETEIQSPEFDETSGNWLCLDFTHTKDGRFGDHPRELLNSPGDLVSWGLHMRLLTDEQAQHLLDEAGRHSARALEVLQQALDLREAIYRVFYEVAEDSKPAEADLNTLNSVLSEALSHARVVPVAHGFVWDWGGNEQTLERISWQVVRSAADLLTSDELDAVRACAAEDCRWLFLDTSKNRSRRWCDMKTCGNRAKARRHYGRKKDASILR